MEATVIKERPILFSGEMVRAILDGRKTQTRRVVKNMPDWVTSATCHDGLAQVWRDRTGMNFRQCPYGRPGDRLWVRETWRIISDYLDYRNSATHYLIRYKDGKEAWRPVPVDRQAHSMAQYSADVDSPDAKWRPSIHMPRWASRITLEVTAVRVERLHSMTFEDWQRDFCPTDREISQALATFTGAKFQWEHSREKWDALNAKRGYPWESNPWVWVVGFSVCRRPVEER